MSQSDLQKFRHEFKYEISDTESVLLQSRIRGLLRVDGHAGNDGGYNIRSLYFDDYDNRCYYENENGTDPREKFRIRIYNRSSELIRLECKRKERGKTLKTSCPLTREQCELLMRGMMVPDIGRQPPLLRKLTLAMQTRHLHPVVIVEYDRIPYVYRNGNVRVTLDMNIASSNAVTRFLDEEIPKRPVMAAGRRLLEVKYDEFLPDVIYSALQLRNLRQTAFSKYYICRKFHL
jgi:SPX domain protein involved in polyphosphate accumulation